jgi:hypothetical protein
MAIIGWGVLAFLAIAAAGVGLFALRAEIRDRREKKRPVSERRQGSTSEQRRR